MLGSQAENKAFSLRPREVDMLYKAQLFFFLQDSDFLSSLLSPVGFNVQVKDLKS